MEKSIHRVESRAVARTLVGLRHEAGLTQVEMSLRIGRTQAYVSAIELGDRRLDAVQLYDWCVACGVNFTELARRLDKEIPIELAKAEAEKKLAPRKKAKRRTGRRLPKKSG